ncbi:MAG: oligosaccharide flippase family protein, partial [Candidatus Hodarchaeota archaeon]
MIARKVTLVFMIRLLQHGLGFLSLFFVAHYMGPEAVGIIAFAFAYVAMFASFSDLGFGSAHIKRVSEGKDLGKCNGTYFTVKALLTAVMTIIILATIFISKYIRNQAFISKEHEIVLYIILLATIVGNLYMPIIITFGARKETAKQNIPLLIEKFALVSIKVFVAIMGLGVALLAGASLISATIALLCFLYLFQGYPIKKPDKDLFKSYATFALPVMFIGFLSTMAQNMDKVMVQFFWSTADVGCYSAAQRISS